ncbi:UNVERIFIED_CONTAM: hypothetical protein FKN15_072050 [Acipenser sinensis]
MNEDIVLYGESAGKRLVIRLAGNEDIVLYGESAGKRLVIRLAGNWQTTIWKHTRLESPAYYVRHLLV